MITRSLVIAALLLLHGKCFSQNYSREWIISLNADATKYYGDFTDDRFQSGGSIAVKNLHKVVSDRSAWYFELSLGTYELNYKTTAKMINLLGDSSQIKIGEVNRTFVAPLTFQLLWRRLIGPHGELFLGGGVELGYFQPYNHIGYPLPKKDDYGKWELGVPLSAQFEYLISDALAFNFHTALHLTFTDYLDGVSTTGVDQYWNIGIGISYSFPAPDRDSDYDGLTNREENEIHRTNPDDADTDHDGLSDKEELSKRTNPLLPDSDGDGLVDGMEVHSHRSNPLDADTDSDGLDDQQEVTLGTSPWKADTDGDSLNDQVETARGSDPRDIDSDHDGMPDGMEANSSPLIRDTDGDGLPDGMESAYSLRPYDEDFDKDGLFDSQEVELRTDPKKADTDNDGIRDYAEVYGTLTNPGHPDTDEDGIVDGLDIEPLGKGLNVQKNISFIFDGLFRHERKVDETSKALETMLHLIRSASPGHVREIEIAVYGETTDEAKLRRDHLEDYLSVRTRNWSAPPLNIFADVKQKGYQHAKLTYQSK